MARNIARKRASLAKRPKLKLIKNSKAVVKGTCKAKRACIREVTKSEPTPYQQEALIIKYRAKARKLGRSILRRWHSRMDLEEVDSLVDLSLCEAVRRFDASKGASFMTFLFYHLKGNLVRAVASAAASAAIPNAIAELTESAFTDGERPQYSNVALNAVELAEAVSSQGIPQPDEALWRKELTTKSSSACDKLDDLEREIVKRIFVHEQQIIDIAAALGYSRCHISRVKKKALSTLHDELRVVMNREDYAAVESDDIEDESEIFERISNRRSVHRRRPRSISHEKNIAGKTAVAA
ncbi:MAG: sigma-70 family RNA polymerase sigma factor [Pseudomonadota bacterium]